MNWMGGSLLATAAEYTALQCRIADHGAEADRLQSADADVAECSADGIPPPRGGPVNSVTETTDTPCVP